MLLAVTAISTTWLWQHFTGWQWQTPPTKYTGDFGRCLFPIPSFVLCDWGRSVWDGRKAVQVLFLCRDVTSRVYRVASLLKQLRISRHSLANIFLGPVLISAWGRQEGTSYFWNILLCRKPVRNGTIYNCFTDARGRRQSSSHTLLHSFIFTCGWVLESNARWIYFLQFVFVHSDYLSSSLVHWTRDGRCRDFPWRHVINVWTWSIGFGRPNLGVVGNIFRSFSHSLSMLEFMLLGSKVSHLCSSST